MLTTAAGASTANWTDYADLVLEIAILLTAVLGAILLVRMLHNQGEYLRNQREYLDRTVESMSSEIAEHEHRMADRFDAARR